MISFRGENIHLDRTGFINVLTWELGNFSVMEGSFGLPDGVYSHEKHTIKTLDERVLLLQKNLIFCQE